MTRVVLNEVGLRDGLQAQAKHLTVAERCTLLDALVAASIESIEIGSFVSPKAVPQMAGTDEVLAYALARHPSTRYNALVPNRRGYDAALAAGCREVNLVISATDTMNQKNIKMTTAEIMAVSQQLIGSAREQNVIANAYLAVAFECPFEGSVNPDHVVSLAQRLIGFGAHRVVIADTIGAASPFDVADLLSRLLRGLDADQIACHFHDTRAMGLANVYAALAAGIRQFDTSIGGLGGCPFAPGASGNVATEDVALLCHQAGFQTGINMAALLEAVQSVKTLTGTAKGGKAHYWLTNNLEKLTDTGDK